MIVLLNNGHRPSPLALRAELNTSDVGFLLFEKIFFKKNELAVSDREGERIRPGRGPWEGPRTESFHPAIGPERFPLTVTDEPLIAMGQTMNLLFNNSHHQTRDLLPPSPAGEPRSFFIMVSCLGGLLRGKHMTKSTHHQEGAWPRTLFLFFQGEYL